MVQIVASSLLLMLLIESIIVVVHSTQEEAIYKYYRFIYNDGETYTSSATKDEEGDGDSSSYSTIVVTNNTTLIMKQDSSSTTTPFIITAPNKSSSNDNNLNTNNEWPTMLLSNGAMFQGQAGIIIGSLGVQEEVGDDPQKNENDVNGGNAIEMYNGQSSSVTGSVAYFFKGMTIIGGNGGGMVGQSGTALYVHGFGTTAYIYGGIFEGGHQGSSSNSSSPVNNNNSSYRSSSTGLSSTGLSIQVMNGGTVHIYSGTFIGDVEIGDSATIIVYGCFVHNKTTSIVSGQFARNNKNYAYEDNATPYLKMKITVLNENNGKVVIIPKSEQECDSALSSSQTILNSSSSSSRGGKIRMLQLLFRFVMLTLIFLYYFS